MTGKQKSPQFPGGFGPAMRSPGLLSLIIWLFGTFSMPIQERVIAYIDGFNLYFGLKAKGWRQFYWLRRLQPNSSCARISRWVTCTPFGQRIVQAMHWRQRTSLISGGSFRNSSRPSANWP